MKTAQYHHMNEKHDDYVLYETKPFQQARERTFLHWLLGLYPCRMKMKDAGWFIVRLANGQLVAVCLYCKKACRGWTKDYDPFKVHRFFSPECVFVQYAHGIQTPSSPIVRSVSHRQQVRPSTHEMAVVSKRRISFEQWPPQSIHRPSFNRLADCGFFYKGSNTTVECFCCYNQLSITRIDDDPMAAHTNQCIYAKHLREHSSRTSLNIQPSDKIYRYETNEINNITFFYLQPVNATTPGILLSVKILLTDEQLLQTILKRLQPIDRKYHIINRMTSSDGPLVNILNDLATNPIELTYNIQYSSEEVLPPSINTISNSSPPCYTCLLKNASPCGVSIRCGHLGLCLNNCFPKWSTCVTCGYTLGRSLCVFNV